MKYRQITSAERYMIARLKWWGDSPAHIARVLGRHRSSICRELARNRSSHDGAYRAERACEKTAGRRSRSRRNRQFSSRDFEVVEALLREDWSPEQVSGILDRAGELRISHETIYRWIWEDKRAGGTLHLHLRGRVKKRRKRYGAYDSRGRLAGKRHISERPSGAENRTRRGHLEADTIMGRGSKHCVLTLVDRKTGYLMMGKLRARTAEEATKKAVELLAREGFRAKTITADNGTEFHGYRDIERAAKVSFFFATPHHSWERGTIENTNGLIRQYLRKGKSLAKTTQAECDAIARKLNERPRKRYGFRSPLELMYDQR